ncbi:hypothetical protein ACS0TY_006927 [Phlomoides rotata]
MDQLAARCYAEGSGQISFGPLPLDNAHPEFRNLCISEWERHQIPSWKSYSLSMKLKRLKQVLKQWSRTTFSSLSYKIESQKENIENWTYLTMFSD